MPLQAVLKHVLPELQREGLCVPGARAPEGRLAKDLTEVLVGRQQLTRHQLLLDGAVDRRTSELLFQCREQGTWAGVAVATDESPPKQPRFRGLRFQITVMYLGIVPPVL